MKYCKKCDVSVNSPVIRCPLCYGTLSGLDSSPEPLAYPDLQVTVSGYNILLRLLLVLSLSVATICMVINYFTFAGTWWGAIVCSNILYLWVSIGTALRRHTRIGFKILVQGLSLAALILALDRILDIHVNWAFNYVLPLLFFTASLAITLVVIVRRVAIRDFILYFILITVMGFSPLLLISFGLVTVYWPCLVSAIYSFLSLVSIFVFADRATRVELKKRFHI